MTTRGSVHGRPPIRATARAEGRFEHGPLDVGEVHAVEYDAILPMFPLMQPGCQGNRSLRCGRQNGHAPSTSNRPPTTMNTRVTEKPARKCGSV